MKTITPSEAESQLCERLFQVTRRVDPNVTALTGLCRLSGGANQETWSFTAQSPAGETPMILRRTMASGKPATSPEPAAMSTMALEACLLGHAASAGVAVPQVQTVLEPDDGIGDGFLMNFVAGETLGGRIVRDTAFTGARKVLAYQCGQALAAIHQIPVAPLPDLPVLTAIETIDGYLAQHRASGTLRPVFELAFQWLGNNLPSPPEQNVLVHGDFRNGNLIVGGKGLRAVLDWELAHLGDPMEDLGWLCVNSWRFGRTDLPVGGFGHRKDLIAGYEAGGGSVDIARVRFWEVLGCLKWGIMCQGMASAPPDGKPRRVERAAIGRRSSETEIDLLNLLAPCEGDK
ncbi:phosphotransferase family protein [Marinobacter sp. ANT_B65]|uniref:phosphotransferase family protein n=1 Tax=Marinobacter sp. ANT_B65 TaxID=2039467 RepID=UPI000BBE1D71|nr:phosphotransferase family protein [Marinobacter sp. ANT_B65]PCM43254.1 phosphotransferase family protein [Marinobacter sp. ANT_B65]